MAFTSISRPTVDAVYVAGKLPFVGFEANEFSGDDFSEIVLRYAKLHKIKELCDDYDLAAIVQEVLAEGCRDHIGWLTRQSIYYCGTDETAEAEVTLSDNEAHFSAGGEVDKAIGSIEALSHAILKAVAQRKLLPPDFKQVQFRVYDSRSGGVQDKGIVRVVATSKEKRAYGIGVHKSINTAFVDALLTAINVLRFGPRIPEYRRRSRLD